MEFESAHDFAREFHQRVMFHSYDCSVNNTGWRTLIQDNPNTQEKNYVGNNPHLAPSTCG